MNTWKNTSIIALCISMITATGLFAQNKTIVTVGGSWWNAGYTWEDDKGNELFKVDPGNNFGPYLSITRNKWNLGVSYLAGKYPIKSKELGGEIFTMDVDMTRGDLNLTVGYRVHQMVNIFVGMKHLKWSLKSTTTVDTWLGSEKFEEEIVNSGPLFGGGASLVIPFGSSSLYGFGSLAFLAGTLTGTYDGFSSDLTPLKIETDYTTGLVALNVGVGYRFPSGLGINGGYRGDFISQEPADSQDTSNEVVRVQGVILTLSYSFK